MGTLACTMSGFAAWRFAVDESKGISVNSGGDLLSDAFEIDH